MSEIRETLPRYLTVKELAKQLVMDRGEVVRALRRDQVPCYRIGRRLRFDPADIARWIEARRVET